ncbi:PTS sugar transporter subunit IIA [Streptococcus catagoni]|uniref:PTS sugar transporter subunit IIA n=1 Tax=Streptococcus catagoni TaxID=2654874 RepID=UPI00140CB7AC|nr:PTS sugar transporter subunit IIA [Streptococcus catagoni]
MLKVIVVAHGKFSEGIISSLELIAGKQEDLVGINFLSDMSTKDIKLALETEIADHKDILILTDLLGGTPFNVSSTLSVEHTDKKIKVLSGLNLAMLIEAIFSRETVIDISQLVEQILEASHQGISDFSNCSLEDDELFQGGI